MALSDRFNNSQLSGFLVNEDLITTGLLTVGEKGIDGYSPIVTLDEIVTTEGREGYIINITDVDHPTEGQQFVIMNGAGISNIILNNDCSLTIYLDDGTDYTTGSIKGETGNGIDRIEKTSSVGPVDTYTIYFTDGNTVEYEIHNGIASTDYNDLDNKPLINGVELSGSITTEDLGLQDKLSSENAGNGISIIEDSEGNIVISSTQNSAEWGNITGDITDQTDLVEYISENGGKIDSISVNGTAQEIVNKNVDITVPTKISDLTDDSDFVESSELSSVAFSGDYNDLNNKPTIPTKTSDLTNDSGFITNAVNDLTNYYLKSETYTQAEVNDLIGAITAVSIQVVQQLPTSDISTNTIYFVPAETSETNNIYDEYIYVNSSWELIGSTKVNLSNYYTSTQVDNLLGEKQDTLTAGSNITISGSTISATGTTYSAGSGIDITNNVISIDSDLILDCGTSTTVV